MPVSTQTEQLNFPQGYEGFFPDLVKQIRGLSTGSTAGSLRELLADPLSNPMFRAQTGAILSELAPSERAARRALTDRFRAAGALKSGNFAQAAQGQEADILRNRANLVGNVAGSTFSRLLNALGLGLETEKLGMAPTEMLSRLYGSVRPLGGTTTRVSDSPIGADFSGFPMSSPWSSQGNIARAGQSWDDIQNRLRTWSGPGPSPTPSQAWDPKSYVSPIPEPSAYDLFGGFGSRPTGDYNSPTYAGINWADFT